MKRCTPFLAMILVLAGCAAPATQPSTTIPPTPSASVPPAAVETEKPAAYAPVAATPAPEAPAPEAGAETINGYLFMVDVAILGDPPEGGLSVFDAVELLSFQDDPLLGVEESTKSDFAYEYIGIIDLNGEEHYEIFLKMKDVNGEFSEDTAIARYAVAMDGRAYVFLEESGEFEIIHNGVANTLNPEGEWWGEYGKDDATLNIVNFDGKTFHFTLTMKGGAELEGVAPVDDYTAEYMDLRFTLAGEVILIEQYEKRGDSAGRAAFAGQYFRQ